MAAENEQYENKQSFYHLEICCRLVGEKFGNPAVSTWTNGDYIKLSSILSRQTSVQISPSTLKRIFGKLKTSERYYPQKATRDALANYAGYTDWENFEQKHPRPLKQQEFKVGETEQSSENIETITKVIRHEKKWPWFVLMLIGIAAAVAAIWQFSISKKPLLTNVKNVKLICSNPEGENPHSATFRIQLPKLFSGDTSDFTIDFGDGRRERKVNPGFVFTHFYEVPGRYYAVLKYNNRPLDTVPVYLKTNGWTATAIMEHDTTRVYPVNSENLFKDGKLQVTTNELFRAGVDTNRTFFVHFANTLPLNISGDDFELTTNVTTSQLRPGVRCSQVNVEIYGERARHGAVLIKPGCVSWAYLRFSEAYKGGETEDLSSIGANLTRGGIVRLQVINKNVKLFVNDKLVYEVAYVFSLEKIYGVRIVFSGVGSVNGFMLRDIKTRETFDGAFPAKEQ